jgi:lysophospholipase L1-like esterase
LSRLGVLNQGIIGNRILHPTGPAFGNLFAPAGLARFDRDVLAQAGVRYVIVLLGINDIGHPGSAAPETDEVSAEQIEAGLRQFVVRAHEKGIKVFGATLTPFEGTTIEKRREGVRRSIGTARRQALNQPLERRLIEIPIRQPQRHGGLLKPPRQRGLTSLADRHCP